MTMTFKIEQHDQRPGEEVVEIFKDDSLVAVLYSNSDGINIVSKYLKECIPDYSFPQSVLLKLGSP